MANRGVNLKLNTDVSELTDSIENVTKAIEKLRESFEQLNSTGLNIEIEQQSEIDVGVDLSSQKDFSSDVIVLPPGKKYYIVKDHYTNKTVAYFLDKETAKLLASQSRWLTIAECKS